MKKKQLIASVLLASSSVWASNPAWASKNKGSSSTPSPVKTGAQVKSRAGRPTALGSATAGSQAGSATFVRPGSKTLLGSATAGSQAGSATATPPRGGSKTLGSQTAGSTMITTGGSTATGSKTLGSRTAGSQVATSGGSRPAGSKMTFSSRYKQRVKPISRALPKFSTAEPGLLVVLGDQSGSMSEQFAGLTNPSGIPISKADALADVVNQTIEGWVNRLNVGGTIKPRLDVAVVGYGQTVRNGLKTATEIAGIDEVADSAELDTGVDNEGQAIDVPVWSRPEAGGGTPMREAVQKGRQLVKSWKRRPAGDHLVMAVNVTDGQPTGATPEDVAAEIEGLAADVEASGGQLLMTNIFLSTKAGAAGIEFPNDDDIAALNDPYATALFEMSSPVPPAIAERYGTKPGARMMMIGANPDGLANVFQAGSSVAGQ